MTKEKAIKKLKSFCHNCSNYPQCVNTDRECFEALDMAIQSLTAISELSQSLKAVNRYEMDKKVLIGFNMAVAIFNKYFGEVGEKMEVEE